MYFAYFYSISSIIMDNKKHYKIFIHCNVYLFRYGSTQDAERVSCKDGAYEKTTDRRNYVVSIHYDECIYV